MSATPICDLIERLLTHGIPISCALKITAPLEPALYPVDEALNRERARDRRRKALLRSTLPPGRTWESVKLEVFERDKYTCRYCGKETETPECDHYIPVTRGGPSTPDNLRTSCSPCNLDKGDQHPDQWKWRLQ